MGIKVTSQVRAQLAGTASSPCLCMMGVSAVMANRWVEPGCGWLRMSPGTSSLLGEKRVQIKLESAQFVDLKKVFLLCFVAAVNAVA